MSGLALVLSLSGLLPVPALVSSAALAPPPAARLSLEPGALLLGLDLGAGSSGQLDALGRTLGQGLGVDRVHFGIDGQPATPFISNFLHAHEIRITHIDPQAVASSVMIQLRVTLD